jgi:hypothetical protein
VVLVNEDSTIYVRCKYLCKGKRETSHSSDLKQAQARDLGCAGRLSAPCLFIQVLISS